MIRHAGPSAVADAPSVRFLVQALLWVVTLFGVIRLPWVAEHIVGALITFQTTVVAWYGATPAPGLVVDASCSGADVTALCLGVTLAFPVAWSRRIAGAAIGATIIIALNAVRIATLYAVASSPDTLDLLHVYVWPTALALTTLLYMFVWIRWNSTRTHRLSPAWVRFFHVAAVSFVVYVAAVPWAFTSAWLAEVGTWTAQSGALLLRFAGASAHATGSVLMTGRGGFQVTQECLFTPMLPLFVSAVAAMPMPRRRRWMLVALAPALFFGLGVSRLFVLVLPSFVIARPEVLVHGFYQFVAGALLLVVAAHYRERRGALTASRRTAAALAAAIGAGLVAGGLWTRTLGAIVTVLSASLGIDAVPIAGLSDPQGAVGLMPGFQMALAIGLWVALSTSREWRSIAAALVWVALLQIAFLMGVSVIHMTWGVSVHALVTRAWALGVPAIGALAWTAGSGTAVGDRGYWRFWQQVGNRFPVLTGAASTTYYFDNERRLLTESFPSLAGLTILKTDLWDEAKNTRIMQWAADQGARVIGIDLSRPIVEDAREAFGARPLLPVVSDVRSLPFAAGAVDAIYSMGTVEHFAETEASVAELARVLRPGGRLILGVPNRHDPFLRPLMVNALNLVGLYGYGFEKSYSRRQLRGMVERAGLETKRETAILFMPGWIRMLDLWCHTRARALTPVTRAMVQPFVWLDRYVPFLRRHGYLVVNVADKPSTSSAGARATALSAGAEYVVDARGCDPAALRSLEPLQALFREVMASLDLHAVSVPVWHVFPGHAGVTGFVVLSESHLCVHTYPELGVAAINLYSCRPQAEWPWEARLNALLGSTSVSVRMVRRGEQAIARPRI